MNESTVLEETRKYTIWAVLGAAVGAVVIDRLEVWDLLGRDFPSGVTFWDRLNSTAMIVILLGGITLLALLVASRVKDTDAAVKPAASTVTKAAVANKAPAKEEVSD